MLVAMSSGRKTANPGERGTDIQDIVVCSKNTQTCKIDGLDYEVTYRLSFIGFWDMGRGKTK